MRVILFGATGMVGDGALRECLRDSRIEVVTSVSRSPTGVVHRKLTEIVTSDVGRLAEFEGHLSGHDACLFCLGVSSIGMDAAAYRRITYDLALAIARALLPLNPAMVFIYVSGAGTDAAKSGWAGVKGATENALLAMGFRDAYMFRPGYIHPVDGFTGKTGWVRAGLAVFRFLYPLAKAIAPRYLTTTRDLARAMLRAAREGAPKKVLEAPDIYDLAHS